MRIPRVALVTLTLGAACGGDDGDGGGSGGGTDVSEKRIEAAIEGFCTQSEKCGALSDTVEACVSQYNDYVEYGIDTDGTDCGDAMLDFLECYANLACDADDDCEDRYDTMVKECPNVVEED